MSWRLQNNPKRPERYEGIARVERGLRDGDGQFRVRHHWTGRVNLDYDALEKPYRWKKPRTVFVQSIGDLFHEKVPDGFIDKVMAVIQLSHQHTFLILTKRAERMAQYFERLQGEDRFVWLEEAYRQLGVHPPVASIWPMPWLWLMVTAENQEQADRRISYLLQTPAAVRGVSVEPMLSPIDLTRFRFHSNKEWWKEECMHIGFKGKCVNPKHWNNVDWIVIGCESGPNRRPMEPEWAIDLVRQCDAAGVAAFVKQIPVNGRVSKDPSEWPTELQRREWPE